MEKSSERSLAFTKIGEKEGRSITAEFDKFILVVTYVPNSGDGLKRLEYRIDEWDVEFHAYLRSLET